MRRTRTTAKSIEHALSVLQDRGYRITSARRDVLSALARTSPRTLKDIGKSVPRVDRVTVYRIIDMLKREGLLTEIRIPGTVATYELSHAHHHHIVCEKCGRLEHVPCTIPERFLNPPRSFFAKVMTHDVLFYGLCRACA